MRSREAKGFLLALALVTAACALAAGLTCGGPAAGLVALCGGGCTALAAGFCVWRGRQIDRLSGYLASVYTGGEILDIRTQREGELSALRDDIYKITTILGEQKAALEADKQLLADFLGDVAHQLKTPISAILLQAELWQDGAVPAGEKDQCARRTEEAAETMRWLVEQLLKLCRLDAAVVRFEKTPTPAAGLLAAAAGAVEPLCRRRKVRLVPPRGGGNCLCDPAWTTEALINLVKNAAEHTPPGGRVLLYCECNSLYTEFAVENEGAPIPPEELPHLFERFWRGKDAAPGSAGIGLSLARAIAQGQGGGAWAENGPRGPRFFLRLYAGDENVTGASPACHPGRVS
ncbi:MAG TPA: HAMP domain-containing histidine kinase [Candidatus Fournierella merdigallinarum]|nr:HAMP domain-containing histidine kinase [Candidatus Fournierella merdigallinarum]